MRNLKLKAVNLVIALMSVSCASCLKSPGIDEPQIAVCTIISPESLDCVYPDIPGSEFSMSMVDAIGFMAVRPKGFAALVSHHDVIHRELNQCKGAR